ncbi:unnamed protein product, partial [Ectocarpus sp. 13 AM-2016]
LSSCRLKCVPHFVFNKRRPYHIITDTHNILSHLFLDQLRLSSDYSRSPYIGPSLHPCTKTAQLLLCFTLENVFFTAVCLPLGRPPPLQRIFSVAHTTHPFVLSTPTVYAAAHVQYLLPFQQPPASPISLHVRFVYWFNPRWSPSPVSRPSGAQSCQVT